MKKIIIVSVLVLLVQILVPGITLADVLPPPNPIPLPPPTCDYPAPPEGCTYIGGVNYNPVTGCGMVLNCPISNLEITKTLRQGMKNDIEVKILQNYLNVSLGLSLVVDGNFGPKTKSAVISFQGKNYLVTDGIVGPKTLAKMKALP